MRRTSAVVLATALCSLIMCSASARSQAPAATNSPGGKPLSERVVAYTLDAHLDTDKKTLDATETLVYKNLTGQPLDTFPFHLYLNAFRPQSTFTTETHFGGGIRDSEKEDDYPKEKIGGITVSKLSAEGYGDLTSAMQFTAPDDGNMEDHTVMQVRLPHPVAPGESITFHFAFHDKFPLSVARNGYKRDFIMGGQWFPKVGVFWKKSTDPKGEWNCHQYHSTTEFFADFGTFDVKLTVPQRYIVGASGVPDGEATNSDGTKTLSFHGEDIHDFAFAASPHFIATDAMFQSSMGPVKIHVLALASHPGAGRKYMDIMQGTMRKFDDWYGPYPYKQITVIDPEPGSEIFGMEYPTLITGGTSWLEPDALHGTALVTEHEFGHQYWYGMVATNEFEEAWLDEGINSYTEMKVLAALLGKDRSVLDSRYGNASDLEEQRISYLGAPDYDPLTRFAYKFRNGQSYGGITYGKTATVLGTLEAIVGEDTMREALHDYFMKYRFTHPTGADFLATIQQTAAAKGIQTDLAPYFAEAVSGTRILDYAVDQVTSARAEWWKPEPKDKKQIDYVDTVYLHRKGDFILPVTVEIVFDDGSRVREHWDGVDRWTKFTYNKKARIVSAEVDPDHVILLDKNYFNNSYTEKASATAANKLTSLWIAAQQMLMQFTTWIV